MPAPEIHPDFALIARLARRGSASATLDRTALESGRKSDRLMSLRVRHRGTTLQRVESPVPMRIIRPKGVRAPAPALLLIHGGGYVTGRARMDDRIASLYATKLGINVVSVEYRLAPEHPYPAALEDCYGALTWLHQQAWVDRDRIAIGGASAGGGLAAALAQLAVDKGEVPVAFQLLVYPMLDDRTANRADLNADDHVIWHTDTNRVAWSFYLGQEPGTDAVPVEAVPSRREDLGGLPPAWIGVGTADLFHDENLEYGRRLTSAGVPCEVVVVAGAVHGFERFAPRKTSSRAFLRAQVEALRSGLR